MFTSIFPATGTLSLQNVLLGMAAAILLGLISAFVYLRSTAATSKSFLITLSVLPVLVEAVILMTSGSLGTAVAVLGTFSLVRFRSAPGTSKEILAIFFAMAIGLACGMGQLGFAGLLTGIVSCLLLALHRLPLGGQTPAQRSLRVTVPEELDYTAAFEDVFDACCTAHQLIKAKADCTANQYKLEYDLTLRKDANEKELLDAIRVRTGNLPVAMSQKTDGERSAL